MKGLSKRVKLFSGMILFFYLLLGLTGTPFHNAAAESKEIIGSAENNGIKFTIDNYMINNNRELIVDYTIESTAADFMNENKAALLKQPSFVIGDNRLQGTDLWHKKVSNQKYQGAVKVDMPQYSPAISNVSFKTTSILNHSGEWAINFEIKK